MPYDMITAERVRHVLSGQRDVVEKAMMGSLCFMVDGNMCCAVKGSALMVRVGRDAHQRMLALPHVRPMAFGNRRPKGFVWIESEGCETDADLATWVQRGIDFIATLPKGKPAKSARRLTASR
jgi:TfoX/Sxy family transcriptional regulator of competence genes